MPEELSLFDFDFSDDRPIPVPEPPLQTNVGHPGAPSVAEADPEPRLETDADAWEPILAHPLQDETLFDLGQFSQPAADLVGRFVVPPFTVLDRRQGYWQERKAKWVAALRLMSGEGRGGALTFVGRETASDDVSQKLLAISNGTSIFDPVLAEVAIRWWSPSDAHIFDPFAGGSVRGVVAASLGRAYLGIDLRPEQVKANEVAASRLACDLHFPSYGPRWRVGVATTWEPERADDRDEFDMILTCPPYGDLEVYSDDPHDLSNMASKTFEAAYRTAILRAVDRLGRSGFSVWVVGNFRDRKTGHVVDLVGQTIEAHRIVNLPLHADLVILDPPATAGMRASATFTALRRPIRVHQHMLVFVKGDPARAASRCERFDEQVHDHPGMHENGGDLPPDSLLEDEGLPGPLDP